MPVRENSWPVIRIVVRGSAWDAASWTSLGSTSACKSRGDEGMPKSMRPCSPHAGWTMTVGDGQAGAIRSRTPSRFRPRSSDAGVTPSPLCGACRSAIGALPHRRRQPSLRRRRSRRPSECSGSHSADRPLAGSPNSGGHKFGHNFEPTQAGPGHPERDARHNSPVQAGCSRFQPQAPKPLKSLGSASSPWVQIPLPPQVRGTFLALRRSRQERQLAIIRAVRLQGPR